MGLFGRKTLSDHQDGLSPRTAFILPPVGNASAISIEYKTFEKLFGREDLDWRVHDRIRSESESGRAIEQFVLETQEGRKVIYFDITDVLRSAAPEPVRDILDAAIERQKDRRLTINLSQRAFLMLFKIVEDLAGELETSGFDSGSIREQLLQVFATTDNEVTQDVPVTLSVFEWVRVFGVTNVIDRADLAVDELSNDLRAYIGGALKEIGPD